ncbi:hypothetical protein V5E97_05980 [Singulisphaera sp. Ch08]|uniref:Carboxypeptidase regulatory-like domain-containing protein n=1 Tax=Singulisphaera sp. Ch08 TaxID=3120278 RepID=A0AAU7CKV4_9BACT
MRHDEGDRRNAAWIARFAFACGSILIIPGAGQTPQAESGEKSKVRPTEVQAAAKTAEDFKKAEQDLKYAEEMYAKQHIEEARLEEARRKLLELKVSALEEEILRGKISLARSDLARAEDRVDLARQMQENGGHAENWMTLEKVSLQQVKFRLEEAEIMLQVYMKYTRPRMEIAKQFLDEGEAAQRLALAALRNEDGAKVPPTHAVRETSPPKQAKSEWQKLAERRLEQRIAALRNELSLSRPEVKWHEDQVDFTRKLREIDYVTESQFSKEKLALQNVKDHLKEMQGKIEGLRQLPPEATQSKPFKNQVTIVDAPQAAAAIITLKGIAREKGTGQPVEGAWISLGAGISLHANGTVTDKDGRYKFVDLPKAEEYSLIGHPKPNDPYFITSSRVKLTNEDENTVNLDLDFVRGIPFRLRVLDKATGKALLNPATGRPFPGVIHYFPVTPNDPYKREVWGYSQTQENGAAAGAFDKSDEVGQDGEYRGAVLPGPGVLCFSTSSWAINGKGTDHKPSFFFPDGKDAVRILSQEKPPVSAIMVRIPGASHSLGIGLNQYEAIIAINPKDDAKEVAHDIRIDQPDAQK